MSQTVVVGVRVPPEDAERFREQASRFGLTMSAAGAALIHGALIAEPQRESKILDPVRPLTGT